MRSCVDVQESHEVCNSSKYQGWELKSPLHGEREEGSERRFREEQAVCSVTEWT